MSRRRYLTQGLDWTHSVESALDIIPTGHGMMSSVARATFKAGMAQHRLHGDHNGRRVWSDAASIMHQLLDATHDVTTTRTVTAVLTPV